MDLPIIVQCTNYSPVFEGKGLELLKGDHTMLGFLLQRLKACCTENVVLATSVSTKDDSLENEADKYGVQTVRGEFSNLVSRLLTAADAIQADRFVRVLGNYPLVDAEALLRLVEVHWESGADYSYNEYLGGVPLGMGCEVIETAALRRVEALELSHDQRSVATLYMRQHPELFKVHADAPAIQRNGYKVLVETRDDLALVRDIASHVDGITSRSVAQYLDEHPVLAKSNIIESIPEVGIEKLYLYPDKLQGLHDVEREAPDPTFPVSVELSLTNKCNLRCVWCSDQDLRNRQGHSSELSRKELFRLFRELKAGGTRGVVIEGGGEPTLHPEFRDVIADLGKLGIPAGLITNGTQPLDAKTCASFDWIRVSLDASTPEEFRRFKRRDLYESVLDNIAFFARHCPTVGIGYVVTHDNLGDMESLILRIREYGVKYIQLRPVVDAPELSPGLMDLSHLMRFQGVGFSVIVSGMKDNVVRGNAELPCKAHSISSVICADGSVFLCGRMNVYDWLEPIGNVKESSFGEIWHGELRKKQHAMVDDAAFCAEHCPACRITAFNRLFGRLEKIRTPNFI